MKTVPEIVPVASGNTEIVYYVPYYTTADMSKFIAPQADETSHQMMLGNIADIAGTLNGLNKNLTFFPLHPDVLAEALAYECKKQQPDPEVIIDLTLMLQR